MNSPKKNQSAEHAGFAPASRGGATKATSNSTEVAQSSTTASAPAAVATPAATDGNIDSASRTTKKKASATKPAAAKKRSSKSSKAVGAGGSSVKDDGSNYSNENEATTIQPIDPSKLNSSSFQPIALPQIQLRIKLLLDKLPTTLPEVPPDYIKPDDNNNHSIQSGDLNSIHYPPIKSFANLLQTTIEEYNLLLSLVSSATYQWGVDRSGASQQNLTVMNSELQQCQDVIANVISGRLSNVLCPAVDILVGKVEIVRGGGSVVDENGGSSKKRKLDTTTTADDDSDAMTARLDVVSNQNHRASTERRINHYTRPLVDPSYVHLCHQIVARNSEMLRYTLATCIHNAQRVIGDYLNAMKKDVGHEANKGGYY